MNYGLGSESRDLPGFMVLLSNVTGPPPQLPGWGAGFLPARYQGTLVDGNKGVPYTEMPGGYTESNRRRQLDFINEMNRRHLLRQGPDSELEARISSYELGYRMQASAPEVFDLSQESAPTRAMYGLDNKDSAEFGTHCILARRLVEPRRALHPASQWRLGRSWQSQVESSARRQTHRPTHRGFAPRSQATRFVGDNARRVGRRVWTYANHRRHKDRR